MMSDKERWYWAQASRAPASTRSCGGGDWISERVGGRTRSRRIVCTRSVTAALVISSGEAVVSLEKKDQKDFLG